MDQLNESGNEDLESVGEDEARTKAKEQDMAEFKKQLEAKREQRKEILTRHRNEKKELEASLDEERKAKLDAYEANRRLRELLNKNNIELPDDLKSSKEDTNISETISNMKEEFERLRDNNIKLRKTLAETTSSLQSAYSDIANLQGENTAFIKQISALKEVAKMSKTMISLREGQLTELKNKLAEIEQSLADREASMLSTDLRDEYVRQLQNIRTLRNLYEERARLAEVTKQSLLRELEDNKAMKEAEEKKCNELKAKVEELEAKLNEMLETVENKNSQITASQSETHGLKNEMSVVNKLFSQVLLGYKNKQDLDKLVHRLEENHGLLTHMAEKENGFEASTALPKLLLELVSQVDEPDNNKDGNQGVESTESMEVKCAEIAESTNTTAEEIVENLPKVWRVLIELLSHQSTPEENTSEKVTTCYKSVETKSGPVLVPSVSQTYIRLKDLIVEKLSLVKEVNRMKQLNVHLESRLGEQERRLCLVTSELSKTWHVVGRLRRHHHQLHTHEKILKYELQQKRKLLNELKEELEYCREKWEQAREKNTQSERDWKKLRTEFTSRKKIGVSFNNSAESGYSDERPSDESSESNDESEHVTEPPTRTKKKFKKSVENMLDSSADFNLVAEREDPASDLLDVAELPLDTQDGDNSHDISDSCNSESLLKSEIICEETEDEAGEIANDSCVEEVSECSQNCTGPIQKPLLKENSSTSDDIGDKTQNISPVTSTTTPTIDPAAILQSIREQNERLAKKDKRLKKLENSGEILLKQTKTTVKVSEQISDALDHLINRPSSSSHESQISNLNEFVKRDQEGDTSSSKITNTPSDIPVVIDPTAILKSVKEQNERLAHKDKKLEELEKSSFNLLEKTKKTSEVSKIISNTLDDLLNRPTSSLDTVNDVEGTLDEKIIDTENESLLESQVTNLEGVIQRVEVEQCEDISITKKCSTENLYDNDGSSKTEITPQDTSVVIDPAAILKSIQEQNERLAQKDIKFEELEKNSSNLLKKTKETAKVSENITNTLNYLLNRPSSSVNTVKTTEEVAYTKNKAVTLEKNTSDKENKRLEESTSSTYAKDSSTQHFNDASATGSTIGDDTSIVSDCVVANVDFKIILENVKKQNESLARKDARLLKLESGCAELVKEVKNINITANALHQKLDAIHEEKHTDKHGVTAKKISSESTDKLADSSAVLDDATNKTAISDSEENPVTSNTNKLMLGKSDVETDETSIEIVDNIDVLQKGDNYIVREPDSRESSEPSTSSEIDHEARFAARDIRLKRLEEQTKSLVSKVNKTTSKGVKINYKLEELHNIYGSQNSRAGTPSEEDRSQNNEDENDEE